MGELTETLRRLGRDAALQHLTECTPGLAFSERETIEAAQIACLRAAIEIEDLESSLRIEQSLVASQEKLNAKLLEENARLRERCERNAQRIGDAMVAAFGKTPVACDGALPVGVSAYNDLAAAVNSALREVIKDLTEEGCNEVDE